MGAGTPSAFCWEPQGLLVDLAVAQPLAEEGKKIDPVGDI